jgi:hypothetical protein
MNAFSTVVAQNQQIIAYQLSLVSTSVVRAHKHPDGIHDSLDAVFYRIWDVLNWSGRGCLDAGHIQAVWHEAYRAIGVYMLAYGGAATYREPSSAQITNLTYMIVDAALELVYGRFFALPLDPVQIYLMVLDRTALLSVVPMYSARECIAMARRDSRDDPTVHNIAHWCPVVHNNICHSLLA